MPEFMVRESGEEQKHVDVIVLGGGLAGLTVALQIKQERPETDILVVERNEHPVPEAAFKVGESVLEGAAYYFAETLGLKEHLESEHFFKAGLRFFTPHTDNTKIEQRPEIGTVKLFDADSTHASYQIDRGRFENELGEILSEMGVTFWDGSNVTNISLADNEEHTVTVRCDGADVAIHARWVVDASGRAALLRRQLGLTEKVEHPVNAAWLRVDQRFNINLWSRKRAWRKRVNSAAVRIFCTTHLCGPGYWVWIIPLAPQATSIGIVADEKMHPFGTFNNLERTLEWFEHHEPQCAKAINDAEILDFMALRHYTNHCQQVFSLNRWAITGVAGAFTDPLYSPGSEFITISNTFITDLIVRSLAGENIEERTRFYDRFYLDFLFNISMREYLGQYPNLGNPLIITLKEIWHAAWYWGIVGLLIYHPKQLCNLALMSEIEPDLQRFSAIHTRVQQVFREWPLKTQTYSDIFVDYLEVYSVFDLHLKMDARLTNTELKNKIAENVSFLEMVACEILEHVLPESVQELQLRRATPQLANEFKSAVWEPFGVTRPVL